MKKLLFSLSALTLGGLFFAQSWQGIDTNAPALHFPYVLNVLDANTIWYADHANTSATDKKAYTGRSIDGGVTWTNTEIVGTPSGATIGDFQGIDANTAFIVTSGSGAQNGVWKSTNGGSSWTKQTTALYNTSGQSFANVVYFWDANNGFTCGDPAGGTFEMYKTSNGGTNWTRVTTAPAPLGGAEFAYTSIKTAAGDNIWVGTDIGRVLYSSNRGQTWQAYQTPAIDFGGVTVENSLANMAFKDGSNGLIVTNDSGTIALYETADSGANWDPIDPVGNFYGGDIAYVPGTTNTYVTSDGTGSSYSFDGGHTWVDFPTDAGTSPYRGTLSFISSTVGYAGGVGQAQDNNNLPISGIYKFVGDLNLAVADVNTAKLKLVAFPNPTVDVVELKASKDIKMITVIDLSGKVLKREKDSNKINVSNLSKGTYVLQATYTDGSVENTKVIKK